MNKQEMIKYLKEEYGMSEDSLKGKDGKFLTNKQLEKIIEEKDLSNEEDFETADYEEVEEENDIDGFFDKEVVKASKKIFDDNDEIMVMSGINGEYTHHSVETGRSYKFRGFGQTAKMPYREIVTISNLYPDILDDGWIVILNKDLIEYLGLKDAYKNVLTPNSIKAIFKKDKEEMMEVVKNLPRGMQVTFVDLARRFYKDGTLEKIGTINAIQDYFNLSLDDNAPLLEKVKD